MVRLDGLKRKRVVFASVSRTRRGKARLHHGQRKVLRRLKVMRQITAKESHICKYKSEIPLDCLRGRYCYTRGFINFSDSGFRTILLRVIRIIS